MLHMLTIHPSETKIPELHQYLLGAVSPRPIALVSTMDQEGNPNLAPFSFFTAIGSNPAMVVFSPALSGRDAKTKNTLENIPANIIG
jgi:flavin reductase (DIM6/NTAB) family NADH-FMN oxidoreductase RutF